MNETDGKILEVVGQKKKFEHEIFDHIYIAEKLQILRQRDLVAYTGPRNYYLIGAGAELEQALVQYTLSKLQSKNFTLMTTPNIIRDGVFEGAGLEAGKMDEMVYSIKGTERNFSLAGTSEIGLCAYFANQSIPHKYLPLKLCCISTCYRKETGSRLDPRGLFRVHQFQKVEMFGVTANETGTESQELHEEFVSIQKELYQDLGLHFNVVDMPSGDLGLPAYRKIDIEAWFPGRNKYDEISSASNCTEFQTSRLQIIYEKDKKFKYAHTVNATACAAQRLIIALLENGQQANKTVALPDCLVPFMYGKKIIKFVKPWTMKYIGPKLSHKKHVTPADILYGSEE
uniref:serine--tRNA ligase n=1 Tax=Phallusia mammillata TaxID=59560 RepID=A0A6F9DRX6_9ASCI|nr:serine--tRNA ligase, mitochondrial-like [Phallusia mammillata]